MGDKKKKSSIGKNHKLYIEIDNMTDVKHLDCPLLADWSISYKPASAVLVSDMDRKLFKNVWSVSQILLSRSVFKLIFFLPDMFIFNQLLLANKVGSNVSSQKWMRHMAVPVSEIFWPHLC